MATDKGAALDIEAIEARLKQASPSPWSAKRPNIGAEVCDCGYGYSVVSAGQIRDTPEGAKADAELIAHAPGDLQALTKRIGELEAVEKAAREYLAAKHRHLVRLNCDEEVDWPRTARELNAAEDALRAALNESQLAARREAAG